MARPEMADTSTVNSNTRKRSSLGSAYSTPPSILTAPTTTLPLRLSSAARHHVLARLLFPPAASSVRPYALDAFLLGFARTIRPIITAAPQSRGLLPRGPLGIEELL